MKNKEGEKVPGLIQENEAMSQAHQEASGLLNTLSRESAKMESATPEKLQEYIAYCEKRIKSDPRIKTYPGLDESYRNAQRKAMALLEEQGFYLVSKKILAARKLDPTAKAQATETIIKDLNYMLNDWQKKFEGNVSPAKSERLGKLIFETKALRDSQFNA